MIFACNKGCGNSTPTTEGKLCLETNEVICQECGVVLEGISKFTKTSMRLVKDVIKKEQRAFSFKCETCDKHTEVCFKNSKVTGKNCSKPDSCMINVTKAMRTAVKEYTNSEE